MIGIRKIHQRYALAVVLFALLARAWIPAGFMPTASADGFTVVLCSSVAFDESAYPNSPSPIETDPADQDHTAGSAVCVFAHLSSAFGPLHPSAAIDPSHSDDSRLVPVVVDSVGSSPALLISSPPVRGPPQSA